jgi:hypothetical protein
VDFPIDPADKDQPDQHGGGSGDGGVGDCEGENEQ